jgi:HlyD family secretion protein
VMTIADEYDVVLEAWLAPGDLIELPRNARVTLYLNSSPLHPIAAKLLYAAHEAVPRPDGQYAYRVRAQIEPEQSRQRVGSKGTARIAGNRVPLIYWILRRPLATLRPYIGV